MNTYDIVAIRESTRVADDINERGARAVIQRLPTSSCGRYLLIYLMDSPQSTAIERAVAKLRRAGVKAAPTVARGRNRVHHAQPRIARPARQSFIPPGPELEPSAVFMQLVRSKGATS